MKGKMRTRRTKNEIANKNPLTLKIFLCMSNYNIKIGTHSVHVGSLCRQRPQVSYTISIAVTKHSTAILLIVILIKNLYRPIALSSVIVKMLPVTIIIVLQDHMGRKTTNEVARVLQCISQKLCYFKFICTNTYLSFRYLV